MIPGTTRVETLHITSTSSDSLRLLLTTAEGAAQACVELSPAEAAALPHVASVCGHAAHCPGRVDLLTNLLVRTLEALDRQRPVIVVRPGDQPAFWLHVAGTTQPVELELTRLDALALLISEHTEVAIETP